MGVGLPSRTGGGAFTWSTCYQIGAAYSREGSALPSRLILGSWRSQRLTVQVTSKPTTSAAVSCYDYATSHLRTHGLTKDTSWRPRCQTRSDWRYCDRAGASHKCEFAYGNRGTGRQRPRGAGMIDLCSTGPATRSCVLRVRAWAPVAGQGT